MIRGHVLRNPQSSGRTPEPRSAESVVTPCGIPSHSLTPPAGGRGQGELGASAALVLAGGHGADEIDGEVLIPLEARFEQGEELTRHG